MTRNERDQLLVDALEHASKVLHLAEQILSRQEIYQREYAQIALVAQAVRMFRTFEAVTVLVREELCDGAGAILRSLLEQYFVFSAVQDKPEHLRLLAAEDQTEKYKALSGLLKLEPEFKSGALAEDNIRAELSKLEKGGGFNAYDWAHRVGESSTYLTLYRRLSVYAHGAGSGLDLYVEMDADGVVLGVRSRVAQDQAVDFVLTGARIMLHAAKAVCGNTATSSLSATISDLESISGQLLGKHCAICDSATAAD
ncbi:DUF5677 domain-containing protein [Acidovorax delafieldii]|uniref:DUF5677 domain-containing protein n=1 Tax=Acidovorax delafieldii TaxID=47920 RepID=UPI003ECFC72B